MPNLPGEILDYTVDLLHDDQTALKNCCLVSKSWIPRSRKHIFAHVRLDGKKRLQSWKKMFRDPSTSPANYTKTLYIRFFKAVTGVDVELGRCLHGFSRVVRLTIVGWGLTRSSGKQYTLAPLCGFSPVLKSLSVKSVALPFSRLFDLILSFPLLEDLTAIGCHNVPTDEGNGPDRLPTAAQPSSIPMTGSLRLSKEEGTRSIGRWLLSLPGGIHFQRLALTWNGEDDQSLAMALVKECSHTLQSLKVARHFHFDVESESAWIDLSKATKLKELYFRLESRGIDWANAILQTITPEHRDFQQLTIYVPYSPSLCDDETDVEWAIGEQGVGRFLELDRLLVRLWESHSIRPKILYYAPMGTEEGIIKCMRRLLPGIKRRGIMDLARWGGLLSGAGG